MTHKRQDIRNAVVDILKDAATSAGDRVYSNRSLALRASHLPILNVVAGAEDSRRLHLSDPSTLLRNVSITVEITAKDVDDESLDDVMDDLCEQVETALNADPTWEDVLGDGGDAVLVATSEIERNAAGDVPIAHRRLTWQATYIF